jgi:tetratricopeptide (TPR) repeat protein
VVRLTAFTPRLIEIYGVATSYGLLIVALAISNLSLHANAQESAPDYCRRAQDLLVQKKFQEARTAAQQALKLDSHAAMAEYLLGAAEVGLGYLGAAEADLKAALELKPLLFEAHETLGQLYLNQKRLNDARRQFGLVLVSHPNDFASLYGLGLAFLMDHQPGPAESAFDRAFRLNSRDLSLLNARLQAQLELKQLGQAAETLTVLDSQFEKQDPRRMDLAELLVMEGAYELAIRQFRRLLEVQPDSYELNYNLALAYHRAERDYDAATLLGNLLAQQETAEFQNLLGDVEQSLGNRSQSVAAFRRAAELDLRNEDYRYDHAQSLAYSSALPEALEAFQKATQDFPGSVRMWLGWGATEYLAGNYKAAARTFLHAADLDPRSPHVYYLLGRAFDASGPLQATITGRFANYLATRPNDAWAEYFYGKILAMHGQQSSAEDLTQAKRHLERATILDPRLAEAHAELGGVFELQNQLEPARQELERAVKLDPNSSAAFYKLASLYRKIGEPVLGQRALERFQELKKKEGANHDRDAMSGFLKPSRE